MLHEKDCFVIHATMKKTVAITRNTEIEPLTSEQGRNCCDLKEKVKQRTKWNVYSHRQRKRAFYKETAENSGLLENPKEVIFWEGALKILENG